MQQGAHSWGLGTTQREGWGARWGGHDEGDTCTRADSSVDVYDKDHRDIINGNYPSIKINTLTLKITLDPYRWSLEGAHSTWTGERL